MTNHFIIDLADAVEISIFEGNGVCLIEDLESNKSYEFNTRFELDGQVFLEPSTNLFSFNNPLGEPVLNVKVMVMLLELMKI